MLSPARMRRVNIFVPSSDVERAAVAIARLGSLHLGGDSSQAWREEPVEWESMVDTHLRHRRRIERLLDILGVEPPSDRTMEPAEPSEHQAGVEEALSTAESEIDGRQEQMTELDEEIQHLKLLREEVGLLEPLDMPLEEIRNPTFFSWIVGTVPEDYLDKMEVILFRIPVVIVPVSARNGRVLVVAAAGKEHADVLSRATRGVFMNPVDLPADIRGVPSEVLPTVEKRLSKREAERRELSAKQADLRERWQHRLSGLWRTATSSIQIGRAITSFDKHGSVYLISGWIPESEEEELLIAVESATEGRADVEFLDPKASSAGKTPTKLSSSGIFKPFQTLVSIFGVPGYAESDPTPLAALTFVVMYGMMFGDVGHGLIIAALGALLAVRSAGPSGARRRALGAMLGYAGLSGAVFGFLYGSIMGRENIISPLWLSPLGDITALLIASVVGGVALLNLGFLMNLVTAVRRKDWRNLLIGNYGLAGIALYWALIGGGYATVRGFLGGPALFVLIVIPALLLFLREPIHRLVIGERPIVEGGWGMFGVRSFFELFEAVISDFSNTLSFVRLGAFAVAHVGLMRVVFALSEVSGPIGRWVILVLGTVIVLGLEGLVVAIQALRLEYYEFFGKFFAGRGVPYRPFGLSATEE